MTMQLPAVAFCDVLALLGQQVSGWLSLTYGCMHECMEKHSNCRHHPITWISHVPAQEVSLKSSCTEALPPHTFAEVGRQ